MTDWLSIILKFGLPAAAIGGAIYAGLRKRNAHNSDSDGDSSFGSETSWSSDSDNSSGGDSGGGGDGGGGGGGGD
ncbi:MAG TPA: hypothetical protein PKW21_11005 [Rhabdaerophilum sp.]|nr:hypothetical protein [Rhabdaerophilum sp.]